MNISHKSSPKIRNHDVAIELTPMPKCSEEKPQKRLPWISARKGTYERLGCKKDSEWENRHDSDNQWQSPNEPSESALDSPSSDVLKVDSTHSRSSSLSSTMSYLIMQDAPGMGIPLLEQDSQAGYENRSYRVPNKGGSRYELKSQVLVSSTGEPIGHQNDGSKSFVASRSYTIDQTGVAFDQAISGLEGLMDKAIHLAEDAARLDENKKVLEILENTVEALHKVSITSPPRTPTTGILPWYKPSSNTMSFSRNHISSTEPPGPNKKPTIINADFTSEPDDIPGKDSKNSHGTRPSDIHGPHPPQEASHHTPFSHNAPDGSRQKISPFDIRLRRPRQIPRNWSIARRRTAAAIACINTALVGLVIGIYAGEVPRIQYQLADQSHLVILGNLFLYIGLAISTLLCWPLPLLHGRKRYTLSGLMFLLPLQYPQALVVMSYRSPDASVFRIGLLLPRALSGLALGLVNINSFSTLLDLFGASLHNDRPQQELTTPSDMRRSGGGMGAWLEIWVWCYIGFLAIGFQIGAAIIGNLNPCWGFYIIVILTLWISLANIIIPDTRSPWMANLEIVESGTKTASLRGEVKIYLDQKVAAFVSWYQEMGAGLRLSLKMFCQIGFSITAVYLAWIYAQIILVTMLLGALLSREYRWYPYHVGLGILAVAIGALIAVPLSKTRAIRTSQFVRRTMLIVILPLVVVAYTFVSAGKPLSHFVPIVFAGLIGLLSHLAIVECYGLLMDTFDISDLQPGANSLHRTQSLPEEVRRRRTDYTSFPVVLVGIFVSQALSFLLAALATGIAGVLARSTTPIVATGGVGCFLVGITFAFVTILWRFKDVQVIPDHDRTEPNNGNGEGWQEVSRTEDWRLVAIGSPKAKKRKMNLLEMGNLSRWTEIRRLNRLVDKAR